MTTPALPPAPKCSPHPVGHAVTPRLARTGCPRPLSRVSAGTPPPTLPHQDFHHVLGLLTSPPHCLKGTYGHGINSCDNLVRPLESSRTL